MQSILIRNPLPRPFVARACVPVPLTDGNPLEIRGALGSADQVRLVALGADFALVQLHVAVPAGTTTVPVVRGRPRPLGAGGDGIPLATEEFVAAPRVKLEIEDRAGARHRFALGAGRPWMSGELRVGYMGNVHAGEFGAFRWWAIAQAGELNRVWLRIRWTNSLRADGTARGEFLFRCLRLVEIPAGVRAAPRLPDPAWQAPNVLVRSLDHYFPQRRVRDFDLVLTRGAIDTGSAWVDGWGVADFQEGGWLASERPLPDLSHAASRIEAELDGIANARMDALRRRQNLPEWNSPAPPSDLFPVYGTPYPGATSGVEIEHLPGVQAVSMGTLSGRLLHELDSFRDIARAELIHEADLEPLSLERHLDPSGGLPFRLFDSRPEWGKNELPPEYLDAPFEWDRVPKPQGPRAYDLSGFPPNDGQHLTRITNGAKVRYWLDGAPDAADFLVGMAEQARGTFWFEGGKAHRLESPALGQGVDWGRGEAWALDTISHAGAILAASGARAATLYGATLDPRSDIRSAGARAWADHIVTGCAAATMPCGLWSVLRYGKVIEDPPISSRYVAHRTNELAYFLIALLGAGSAFNFDVQPLLDGARRGVRDLVWKLGTDGPLERHVLGVMGGALWTTRAEAPASLIAALNTDTYTAGDIVGILDLDSEFLAWTGAATLEGGVDALKRGGAWWKGSPVENWSQALRHFAVRATVGF